MSYLELFDRLCVGLMGVNCLVIVVNLCRAGYYLHQAEKNFREIARLQRKWSRGW